MKRYIISTRPVRVRDEVIGWTVSLSESSFHIERGRVSWFARASGPRRRFRQPLTAQEIELELPAGERLLDDLETAHGARGVRG